MWTPCGNRAVAKCAPRYLIAAVIHDAILNRAPISSSRLNPELPSKIEEVISKALEKDPRLRY